MIQMPTESEPVTVILGDCLEVLKSLPDGCVDAVITDPPYGVGLIAKQHKWFHRSGTGYQSTEDTPENVSTVVVPAIEECLRIARSVVVTSGVRCMWRYPVPDDVGTIFNKSGTGRTRWGFSCNNPVLYYGKCPYMAAGLGGRPNSWQQSAADFADDVEHPCPKPIGMMRWLVVRGSLPSELILDPFAGSGTTGVAAIIEGRRAILIEKEPKYVEICRRRIDEAMGRGPGSLFKGVA